MLEDNQELPAYIHQLYANSDHALQHLLPNSQIEGGILYHDSIHVDLTGLRFIDHSNQTMGELHELWRYVKGQTAQESEADIKHFLLNIKSPTDMARFSFSPEEMNDPNSMYGKRLEIFPSIHLYAGTTTLLAGYNGSGKSTLATQIAHIVSGMNVKSFILSPEMPPDITWRIMHRQATHVGCPTPAEWHRANQHCLENFMVSTIEDRITPDIAIQQFDNAYNSGYRLIVLDSLTCVRAGHELHQQADFSDLLRNWSRSHTDCFLIVVAHMRKPSGYIGGQISRYDIRGAGEVSDLAGHVWLMQRKNPFSEREKAQYGEYSAKLIVDKNRATGKLVCKMLRFSNMQKLYHVTQQPPSYVDYMIKENVERIY